MNILIVEDDATELKLVSVVLSSDGHCVSGHRSAEEAMTEIRASVPQVILLDLKLPGMNGLDLARRLKADPATRDVPIVAVTAAPETFSREAALAAGCDAYIRKPLDTRALDRQIASAVSAMALAPASETSS
jgi:CheY-like chemotaxis protein